VEEYTYLLILPITLCMYLVICNYDSDSERKRIEYVFGNSDYEPDEMQKIKGISRIINDDNIENLLSELYLRTAATNVSIYKLSPVELKNVPEPEKIRFSINKSKETVEAFISYLLAQKKAVYKRSLDASIKLYESATKKGYAEIKVSVKEGSNGVEVQIEINAEEPNRSHLIKYFAEEFALFT